MKFNTKPTLDKWIRFHDALVGESYFYPGTKNGQRVITAHLDTVEGNTAKCAQGERWVLGKPGNTYDYMQDETPSTFKSLRTFVRSIALRIQHGII